MINFLYCHKDHELIDDLNEKLNFRECCDGVKFIPISEDANLGASEK